jgi:hypothetical protein
MTYLSLRGPCCMQSACMRARSAAPPDSATQRGDDAAHRLGVPRAAPRRAPGRPRACVRALPCRAKDPPNLRSRGWITHTSMGFVGEIGFTTPSSENYGPVRFYAHRPLAPRSQAPHSQNNKKSHLTTLATMWHTSTVGTGTHRQPPGGSADGTAEQHRSSGEEVDTPVYNRAPHSGYRRFESCLLRQWR